MKAWNYRLLPAACFPVALTACATDLVPSDNDASSGSGSTPTSAASTTSASNDDTTPTPPPPTTSPSNGETTSAPMQTGDDTGTSGPPPVETTGEIAVCGNNIIEGDEKCDLNQVNGETCTSLGYQGGVLGCMLTCEDYNLLGCFICGNGVVDIAEDCEGEVPDGISCLDFGNYEAGTLACGADCKWDFSDCSFCGDGIQAGPEDCDGIDFGDQTCASLGFEGGDLGCNFEQCRFVYSGCFGGQYIENFEDGPPMPGEFSTGPGNAWTVDDENPIDGAYSARSAQINEGGISDLNMVADFPAGGTVTFDHETSCEAGSDFLEFRVDGALASSWTGISGPASYEFLVGAGEHTLQWRFVRNGFESKGLDAVFIDNVVLDGGIPVL